MALPVCATIAATVRAVRGSFPDLALYLSPRGPLAQLGERLPCTEEVSGSIPLRSTTSFTLRNRAFGRSETCRELREMALGKRSANAPDARRHHRVASGDRRRHRCASGRSAETPREHPCSRAGVSFPLPALAGRASALERTVGGPVGSREKRCAAVIADSHAIAARKVRQHHDAVMANQ